MKASLLSLHQNAQWNPYRSSPPTELLIGALFADGHGFCDRRRDGLFANEQDSGEDLFEVGFVLRREFDLDFSLLQGVVDDAGGDDSLLFFEIVEVVEQLVEGGFLAAFALFDLVDFAVFGEVDSEEVVHENVFTGFVRVAVFVEERPCGDALLPGVAAGVFLLHAVRVPPESPRAEDIVLNFSPADPQISETASLIFINRSCGHLSPSIHIRECSLQGFSISRVP